MIHGFYKVCAGVPEIVPADCRANAEKIKKLIDMAADEEAVVLVLPELCLTGSTCGDLFYSQRMIDDTWCALLDIAEHTQDKEVIVFAGVPVEHNGKLYDCAAAMYDGMLIGLTPKTSLTPAELRWFSPWDGENEDHLITDPECGVNIPFGNKLIYLEDDFPELLIAAGFGSDEEDPAPRSTAYAQAGANLIVSLSAFPETVGGAPSMKRAGWRRSVFEQQSSRLMCGYVCAGAGDGESTTDAVFAGHCLICENGVTLAESLPFRSTGKIITSEIDIRTMNCERRRSARFRTCRPAGFRYEDVGHIEARDTVLTRKYDTSPFAPESPEELGTILLMQAKALAKRLDAARAPGCVVGVSGGLDSTLALLAAVEAVKLLGREPSAVTAVTMPCFGTTSRTRSNAEILCERLGVSFRCVDIKRAVDVHFEDIGHDPEKRNAVYENAQARERTQVLMDIANARGDIVVGTGDLSELALGWATYGGDQMSMYGVNASIPKTLVRLVVGRCADTCGDPELSAVLKDILDTPVSPELLPADDAGAIAQKTEDLVGPYELHDFFLYHFARFGTEPEKIKHIARHAFKGSYEPAVIDKWLEVFIRRFFAMQFKRSCMPDGPCVGEVSLSPRGGTEMPSDASSARWF